MKKQEKDVLRMPTHLAISGQSLAEYSLILGAISLAAWAALVLLGGSISGQFTGISGELANKGIGHPAQASFASGAQNNHFGGTGSGDSHVGELNGPDNAKAGDGSQPGGQESSSLALHDANGGETNVSSAEGNSVNVLKSLAQTATVAQSLKELADLTKNPTLGGLSHQALMSASVQASYQVITNPENSANAQLQGLKKVATANHTDAELAANPGRMLSSIEQWNQNMEIGRAKLLGDNRLTTSQKTEAVALLDQIVSSTRQTYGAERLNEAAKNLPRLDDASFIAKTETFTQLRKEAKKALASSLSDQTLKSTLQGGVALEAP